MSGHSKWATTKHKKAVIDAKRGKRLARDITLGGDVHKFDVSSGDHADGFGERRRELVGGGARSELWLRIVASVLELPVERLAVEEALRRVPGRTDRARRRG